MRHVSVMLAAASGVLLVFCFPRIGHPFVAWVAVVPLLLAVVRARSVRAAFGQGLLTGAVFFAGTVYWLPRVMTEYGGLSTVTAWGAHLLLVAYLALFPALVAAGTAIAIRRVGALGVYCAAPLWVTTELGRVYLFTGFPWELLGYSQTSVLPVAQLASVVGVLGLSLLVMLVNASVAFAVTVTDRRRQTAVVVTATLLLTTVAFGGWRAVGVHFEFARLKNQGGWRLKHQRPILLLATKCARRKSPFSAVLATWLSPFVDWRFPSQSRGRLRPDASKPVFHSEGVQPTRQHPKR